MEIVMTGALTPVTFCTVMRMKRKQGITAEVIVRMGSLVNEVGILTKETPKKYIFPFRKILSFIIIEISSSLVTLSV